MTNELKNKIKNSIHRETYELMALMGKTGANYLEDVDFLRKDNALIRNMSKDKELLDLNIVINRKFIFYEIYKNKFHR